MGCYVPAESYSGTIIDRIFTRLGAFDNMLANKSTFFVELEETSQIIRYASSKSLVIVDELGRGTSTFDGYALARAVLNHLVNRIRCISMFTTHYRWLVDDPAFKFNQSVQLCTMLVKRKKDIEGEEADECSERAIVFLYKFIHGVSDSSFGIGVGEMAGLP